MFKSKLLHDFISFKLPLQWPDNQWNTVESPVLLYLEGDSWSCIHFHWAWKESLRLFRYKGAANKAVLQVALWSMPSFHLSKQLNPYLSRIMCTGVVCGQLYLGLYTWIEGPWKGHVLIEGHWKGHVRKLFFWPGLSVASTLVGFLCIFLLFNSPGHTTSNKELTAAV